MHLPHNNGRILIVHWILEKKILFFKKYVLKVDRFETISKSTTFFKTSIGSRLLKRQL